MELQEAKKILAVYNRSIDDRSPLFMAIDTILEHLKTPEIKPDKVKIQCLKCERVFILKSNGKRMIHNEKDNSITKGGIKLKCSCLSDQLEFVVSL